MRDLRTLITIAPAVLWPLYALLPMNADAQSVIQTTLPGSGRPLTVVVPESGSAPGQPIVISLHYGGTATPYYGRGLLESAVVPGLRGLGAIMLAPDCAAGSWSDTVCAEDVIAAIDFAAERYQADAGRVLLTGYSKGGIGTWALSDAHPQRFAAAIVMASRGMDPHWNGEFPVPVRVIHGERDELFPIDQVRAAAASRRAAGQDVQLAVLPGVTHYDIGAFATALAGTRRWLENLWAE